MIINYWRKANSMLHWVKLNACMNWPCDNIPNVRLLFFVIRVYYMTYEVIVMLYLSIYPNLTQNANKSQKPTWLLWQWYWAQFCLIREKHEFSLFFFFYLFLFSQIWVKNSLYELIFLCCKIGELMADNFIVTIF